MYNDDENISGANLNNGAPSSENFSNDPENIHTAEHEQKQENPDISTGENEAENGPYYEPWQQPLYRDVNAQEQEPFSPGIHTVPFNVYQRGQAGEPPRPEKKRKSLWNGLTKAVCLVLICAIASAGATYGVLRYSGILNNRTGSGFNIQNEPVTSDNASGAAGSSSGASTLTSTGNEMSAEDIYSMAVNQVVGVNSEAKTNIFGQSTASAVSGSGFIVSADGYIVTNYHVIQYADQYGYTLTVMLHDGKSYPAKIIGYDQDNDIAVIKIDATGLSAAKIGDNKKMKVGDKVYAVGNPLGELDYTMTNGIVSALDRVIQVDETTSINMFQIDAAVNAGNSGGPLYNSKGEVVGIVSAKYASTGIEGLGFAIPINDAMNIVNQLITNGHVVGKASMGITVRTVTSAAAEYYNLPAGAYVLSVQPGSCAEKAGLKVGDVITKLGDTAVTSADTLKTAKKNFKAGDKATIIVNREGKELSLTITFDEQGVTATSSNSQARVPIQNTVQSGFGGYGANT